MITLDFQLDEWICAGVFPRDKWRGTRYKKHRKKGIFTDNIGARINVTDSSELPDSSVRGRGTSLTDRRLMGPKIL